MTESQIQFMLALYNSTQAEITRYRDREWATPGIFVAALATIVGFIITNDVQSKSLWWAFDIVLIVLAIGNTSYTIFVHNRLTQQRNIRARIEFLFELDKIKVSDKKLLPFKVIAPTDDNFNTGWINGFWSHIFPFIIFGIGLCCFGMWLIHR